MTRARTHHAAVLLQGGKVLVAGGAVEAYPAMWELYDPATNGWTSIEAFDPRPEGPTATLLKDGRAFVDGGQVGQPPVDAFFDPVTGMFIGTGVVMLDVSRSYATSALLPDGSVLTAGGVASPLEQGALATTEFYSPKASNLTQRGSWAPGPAMSVGHAHHTMTTLRDGLILVAGGRSASASAASGARTHDVSIAIAELYDPAAQRWSPAASLNRARGFHSAVLLADGRVLVAGGRTSGGAVTATTRAPGRSMSVARADFAAVELPAGNVLLIGGQTTQHDATAAVDVYDPARNTIASVAPMKTARAGHAAVLMPNGKVLVAGGVSSFDAPALASAEIYDPGANVWSPAASMHEARVHAASAVTRDGRILIVGGDGAIVGAPPIGNEIYDAAANTWAHIPTIAQRFYAPTATGLNDGRIVIAEGLYNSAPGASIEIYDPATGQTTGSRSADPPQRGYSTASLLPGERLLIVGGLMTENSKGAVNTTSIYDPAQDGTTAAWTAGPVMSVGHCHHSMTTLRSGRIFVAGGRCQAASIAAVEILDVGAMTWSTVAPMSTPRGLHTATLLPDGRVFVAGGYVADGAPGSTTEIYTPA